MSFHFEPDLDYQLQAIEAVCDLFRGQEVCRTEFTVTKVRHNRLLEAEADVRGVGNRLTLLDDQILDNLRDVQLRGELAPSDAVTSGDFTVEMETGTGKTYVYLRTMYELKRRYGFSKFVIVVPSVAIKEGVYKTLQMTEEHFSSMYAGEPCHYFLYDSSKLGDVRSFATSSSMQVMIVTVGAINKKDINNLYKTESEQTGDEAPIDLIRATRPIVIVDEPQSVDGGLKGQGKQALDAMNPLCTLRYSATHVDKHHMLYRLDAVDAYARKLVKQIEVAAATVEAAHNKPYVRLVRVEAKGGSVSALVELDVQTANGVKRQPMRVYDGEHLEQTTRRDLYREHRIGTIEIDQGQGKLQLQVPGEEVELFEGDKAWGDVDDFAVQREMIRRTISEHLDKELLLRPKGIKVLSLFFVDHVANYRYYEGKTAKKGPFALIFEEEYRKASKRSKYVDLFGSVDLSHPAERVHDGYFSVDKDGGWTQPELDKEGELKNKGSRDDAERAFQLIMRDKERLLKFETPLKFIFSHSALREGWDNPNVFQICTLRDIRTERERRQTIGRGLRICVNQDLVRERGPHNTLTVIANESYKDFAENLQKEIEKDTGIKFGVVEKDQFAAIAVMGTDGKRTALGTVASKKLWDHLQSAGMINASGKIQDKLRQALHDDKVELPAEFAEQRAAIVSNLTKLAGKLEIKNADERRKVAANRVNLDSAEFKALWDRIKYRTTYRVAFDNAKLIQTCIEELAKAPDIEKTRLQWRKADVSIGRAGVEATEREGANLVVLDEGDIELPDILTELERRTHLTRHSLGKILLASTRLRDFERNPQAFVELAAKVINDAKRFALVDGIRYQRVGETAYYRQELFDEKELTGYLRNLIATPRAGVYEQVVCDSGPEKAFAEALERNSETVRVFAKLPGWFEVPTPLGAYNPDWAVLMDNGEGERLYFVVETKPSAFLTDLCNTERAKIHCGEKHFEALAAGSQVGYECVHTYDELLMRVQA